MDNLLLNPMMAWNLGGITYAWEAMHPLKLRDRTAPLTASPQQDSSARKDAAQPEKHGQTCPSPADIHGD